MILLALHVQPLFNGAVRVPNDIIDFDYQTPQLPLIRRIETHGMKSAKSTRRIPRIHSPSSNGEGGELLLIKVQIR